MISKKMFKLLNDQMNLEEESARIYRAMAVHLADVSLDGFSSLLNKYADEEMEHSCKLKDYLEEQNEHPLLAELPKPPAMWDSLLVLLQDALKHEKVITAALTKIMNVAKTENDYQTEDLMHWYLTEQIEEEDKFRGWIDKYLLFADGNGAGLFLLDKKAGEY